MAGSAVFVVLSMAAGVSVVCAAALAAGGVVGTAAVAAASSAVPPPTQPPGDGAPPGAFTAHIPSLWCDTVGLTIPDGRRGWYLGWANAGESGDRCFVPAGAGSCASPVEFPSAFLQPLPAGAASAVAAAAAASDMAGPEAVAAAAVAAGAAAAPAAGAAEGSATAAAPSPPFSSSPLPLSCGEGRPETEPLRTTPVCRAGLAARLKTLSRAPITGRFLQHLTTHALPAPLPLFNGGGSLMYERPLVRLLGLTRNTVAGAVHRETDVYDVLGFSRVTVGTCTEADCADSSAVAVAGAQARDFAWRQLPLLMLAGDIAPGSAGEPGEPSVPPRQQTISMGDEGVLTLGWAVLANPAWLRPAASEAAGGTAVTSSAAAATAAAIATAPSGLSTAAQRRGLWDLRARVTLDTSAAPGGHPNPSADYYLDGDDTRVSARWLPAIVAILCRDPVDSFVRLPHVVCRHGWGGAHEWQRGGGGGRGGDRGGTAANDGGDSGGGSSPTPTPADHLVALGAAAGGAEDPSTVPRSSSASRVMWFISPRLPNDPGAPPPRSCPPLADLTRGASRTVAWRPPWVAARGVREINPLSVAEAALAASCSTCLLDVAQVAPREPQAAALLLGSILVADRATHFDEVEAELRRFSNIYDPKVFYVEPPSEPTAMGPLMLALIVLVPEAIALISVFIASPQVGRRELVLAALFFVAGLVSSGGIILLAVTEIHGASWRAAAVRDSLRLDLGRNATAWANRDIQLTGTTDLQAVGIYRTETVVVLARHGYHPRLLIGLATAFSAVYVGLSGGVVALIARRAGRPPPPPRIWRSPRQLVMLFVKKRRGRGRWRPEP